jgi:uncharacterized protein YcaQ
VGLVVLAILFRDRLVGRIEPRIDTVQGAVQVLAVWWEDGFEASRAEGFVDALREALGAYLRFAKAERIEWPTELHNRSGCSTRRCRREAVPCEHGRQRGSSA